MKKVLLCILVAGLMMPAVAQQSLPKVGERKSLYLKDRGLGSPMQGILPVNPESAVQVKWLGYAGISKSYDRQTQGSVYPMTQRHSDGFIGCTWTNEDNPPFQGSSTPLRGIGYSYSTDGGSTWSWKMSDPETQENRLGGIPVYWPSYAQWGPHGEAFMARSYDSYDYQGLAIKDGLVLFTRPNRGEGEWTITPVPYPEGANPLHFMAWGSMTTSGDNHQYIHIITPMSNQDIPSVLYHGYSTPTLYYRTQDGTTWEVEGQTVPEVIGQEWPKDSYYADGMSWAVQGNTVVCSFINMGSHGYVIRSHDNGNTWESIKFFDSPIQRGLTTDDYADSVYVPSVGTVALDNNGKIHIAFSAITSLNSGELGSYWPWAWAQFLSYWNEDMDPIDGDADFKLNKIAPLLMGFPEYDGDYFDWAQSTEDQLYVKSTTPKWPVIGYFIPVLDDHLYTFLDDFQEWAGKSYGQAGMFSFPQMAVDGDNTMHLVYLGLLDGGSDGENWLRHPFHTSTSDGGKTWTQTEYLVSNNLQLIDQEFAYLTLAGTGNGQMTLMAQTDAYAGVYTYYGDPPPDHANPTNNFYNFFSIPGYFPPYTSIENIDYTSLTMSVVPNPASGQAKVQFSGKGNITVYNMLGQTVYHAENVENEKIISLTDLTTGVYFVTVRSGNAVATQKLVVR